MTRTKQSKTKPRSSMAAKPATPSHSDAQADHALRQQDHALRDKLTFPFLVKTLITFTRLNAQGVEERHKDEVAFKLDFASAEMPWYVLRNYSVPKYLTKKYGPKEVGWQLLYEIKIVKMINRANPNDITQIPLRVMTLDQLALFCQRWELSVNPYEFFSVEKAREMVTLCKDDPTGFKKHLEQYRAGKQRTYPELDAVRKTQDSLQADLSEFSELEAKEQSPAPPNTPKTKQNPTPFAFSAVDVGNESVSEKKSITGHPEAKSQTKHKSEEKDDLSPFLKTPKSLAPKTVPGNPFAGV